MINSSNSSRSNAQIIKYPIITDKATRLLENNQYSFIVDRYSNKLVIKTAIETLFNVKVTKVNTSIVRGKLKSFKGNIGYKKDIKKAIVTLAEGNTIDSSLEIK